VNPAVTLGFLLSGRVSLMDAIGYWVAQFVGGIGGALLLWGVLSGADSYARSVNGLGANGYGDRSATGINIAGAFAIEGIMTFLFVFVVLAATSRIGSPGFAGLAIGLALATVHLIGIPLTGTSVNPARSLGPAIVTGTAALKQVWLFIVAPLVGGLVAAFAYRFYVPAVPSEVAVEAAPAVRADRAIARTRGIPPQQTPESESEARPPRTRTPRKR
jgi:aquaporin Z